MRIVILPVATVVLASWWATNCGGPSVCSSGYTDCMPPGYSSNRDRCVDTSSDRLNCGACNNACGPTQGCKQGVCVDVCPAGLQLCDGGCAVTAVDPANCGGCGHGCGAGQSCTGGACSYECPPGQAVCATDGGAYCASLGSDSQNCGRCGMQCAAGAACMQGVCGSSDAG